MVCALLLGGGSYHIAADNLGSACDGAIKIYDSTTATAPLLTLDEWRPGLPKRRTWVAPHTGNFYVLVHNYDPSVSGENTSYSLSLTGDAGAMNVDLRGQGTGTTAVRRDWPLYE